MQWLKTEKFISCSCEILGGCSSLEQLSPTQSFQGQVSFRHVALARSEPSFTQSWWKGMWDSLGLEGTHTMSVHIPLGDIVMSLLRCKKGTERCSTFSVTTL